MYTVILVAKQWKWFTLWNMTQFGIPEPEDNFYDLMYKWKKKMNLVQYWIPEIVLLQGFFFPKCNVKFWVLCYSFLIPHPKIKTTTEEIYSTESDKPQLQTHLTVRNTVYSEIFAPVLFSPLSPSSAGQFKAGRIPFLQISLLTQLHLSEFKTRWNHLQVEKGENNTGRK